MHKVAMEMGKWAMEKAKAHGFDNLSPQDWDDLKDCMEVVKCAVCADKDYRIVEAMDEAEQEDKFYGRMGYRGRDSRGRFVHRPGRGRSAGYTPYMHMIDDMDEYDMYDEMPYLMGGYRMGYSGGRNGNSGSTGNSGNYSSGGSYGGNYSGNGGSGSSGGRYGYDGMRQPSRRGETYDRYRDNRRHYHETKDADSKRQMDDSMKEYMEDTMDSMKEIWKDADPTLRQTMKADLTKMIQQLQ